MGSDCTLCPLHRDAISVCVPGRGDGKILIVGQNPGAQEDLENAPFVGKSGQLLDRMLSDAGYGRDDVRFTNAVRCKTPGNRKPTQEEINACSIYLAEEIAAVQPKAIVALGEVPLRSLTRRGGFAGRRGVAQALHPTYAYTGAEVWPTFHPAFVLRSPQAKNVVVTDLQRVRDSFRPDDNVLYTHTDLPTGPVVSLDIETDFDYKTKKGGDVITQISLSDGVTTYVSSCPVNYADLSDVLSRMAGRTLVSHNGWKFDLPRLRAATGLDLPDDDDTIVLAYLDDESQPLNLEALSIRYLGVKGWKEARDAEPGSPEFALYNARDALYTYRLREQLVASLGERRRIADLIIHPAFEALKACSERGIYIDKDAVHEAKDYYEHERDLLSNVISQLAPGVNNPNSSRDIGAALEGEGHDLPRTETGLPATGVGVLSNLAQTPLVASVLSYRKTTKALSAAVYPYERLAATVPGRVHPEYTLWRTLTGRTSASKLNVQQLAREPRLRAFFSAPSQFEFTQADYGAIEFRVAAYVAGERGILERYEQDPNWDAHTFFASILYGVSVSDVSKEQRQIAKSANFGLLYRALPPTLQAYAKATAGLDLSIEECRRIYALWHATFPAFRGWYGDTAGRLAKDGYIETITGRRRHFGDPDMLTNKHKFAEALREAVNMQVQSPAADIALLGLGKCYRMGLPVNGFFHDANSFEFPVGTTADHLNTIYGCMVTYPKSVLKKAFGVDLNVPLTIEVKTKDNVWNLSSLAVAA